MLSKSSSRLGCASEIGALAFKQGYARWSEDDRADDGLAPHALDELRAATSFLA